MYRLSGGGKKCKCFTRRVFGRLNCPPGATLSAKMKHILFSRGTFPPALSVLHNIRSLDESSLRQVMVSYALHKDLPLA